MNPILRNVLAVVAGWFVGSFVNMGLILLSPVVIPPPAGVDPTNAESLAANIHLFEMRHFIMPFLAHALGTLVGAFIAAKIATTHKMKIALGIGLIFFLGGIVASRMIPAPTWFSIADLVLAYFPMAWLGGLLAGGNSINKS